jgi:hypothetical protein
VYLSVLVLARALNFEQERYEFQVKLNEISVLFSSLTSSYLPYYAEKKV